MGQYLDIQPASLKPQASVKKSTSKQSVSVVSNTVLTVYASLLETFHLYVGWLLFVLSVAYLLGGYMHTRALPFTTPYITELIISPVFVAFTFGWFLAYVWLEIVLGLQSYSFLKGVFFALLFVGTFMLFVVNI